jgi:peptide/nickel transport system permease protein
MIRFIVKRVAVMVLIMLAVSLAVFIMQELSPGSVATKVLGPYSTEQQRQLWLEAHGYLEPVHLRYLNWLGDFLTGDFGESTRFRVPVADILWPRLGNTAILGLAALLVMVPLALLLGVLAGMREGSPRDRAISVLSTVTTSIPEFASAVFLASLFVFALHVLPGTSAMADGFDVKELILPALVLVLYGTGYVARMTRASMAEVMTSAYIRTAVLKGLPMRQVIWRHALRNALIAPFTVIMLYIPYLLSGVIVAEVFFAYKGFGALLLEAALNDDIFLIEACAMIAVAVVAVTQTVSDIGYMLLNPRIRFR